MNRTRLFLGAGVGLLILLNIWQWWPRNNSESGAALSAGGFLPGDFYLKIKSSPDAPVTAGRNIFRPKLPPPPKAKVVIPPAPPIPPPKTPEQLAEEAARAELTQIKLIGIVFRRNRGQAFLVKGDQVFLAQTGDKVGDHFVVESIGTDNVLLKDTATNINGQIQVSGQ